MTRQMMEHRRRLMAGGIAFNGLLYDNGWVNPAAGSFVPGGTAGILTMNPTNMSWRVTATSSGSRFARVATQNKLPFNGYTKLCFDMMLSSSGVVSGEYWAWQSYGYGENIPSGYGQPNQLAAYTINAQASNFAGVRQVWTVPVSHDGDFYVTWQFSRAYTGAFDCTATIYKIWLE